ncbi:MAG TPA: inositol monophosphatase family protein, partial [Anaerolineales bacterium]|nr:inositol monophosphatase family protein [Anaerolineales bacterium]
PRQTKHDRSPVTVADFAVQAVVAQHLAESLGAIQLVAEEDSRSLRGPDGPPMLAEIVRQVRRILPDAQPEQVLAWIDWGGGRPGPDFWTLDPIDGTKGFLRGGQYALALARIERGRVTLAGLACPQLVVTPLGEAPGVLAIAARGAGAWAQPLDGGPWIRLRASGIDDPAQARWLRSVEGAHTDEAWLDRLVADLGIVHEPVRMDSQAKYVVVAAGDGDLIFRLLPSGDRSFRERIWDQAAAALLVEEAGGRISDLMGAVLDFGAGPLLERNLGVLTSNGLLHDRVLAALRRVPQA